MRTWGELCIPGWIRQRRRHEHLSPLRVLHPKNREQWSNDRAAKTLHEDDHSFIHPFIHHACMRSFMQSFIRPFVHAFIRSSMHSFVRSCIRPFTRPFGHSFIHAFPPSFVQRSVSFLALHIVVTASPCAFHALTILVAAFSCVFCCIPSASHCGCRVLARVL